MSENFPKKILIMPDFAPDAYAWDYEEGAGDLITPLVDYFPDNLELKEIEGELSKWCDWFNRDFDIKADDSNFPWEKFHRQGLDLAKRLARNLAQFNIEVYYQYPHEDLNRKGSKPVKVEVSH